MQDFKKAKPIESSDVIQFQYALYCISELAHDAARGVSGFEAYGAFNLCKIRYPDLQFADGYSYRDKAGDVQNMLVFRNDIDKVLLFVHGDDAPIEMKIEAGMRFPRVQFGAEARWTKGRT